MGRDRAIRISLIWWSQVVFDALVFWLTIAKTWKARMPLAPGASERDLLLVLRRDGAMYFGYDLPSRFLKVYADERVWGCRVMALANLMVIISFYVRLLGFSLGSRLTRVLPRLSTYAPSSFHHLTHL